MKQHDQRQSAAVQAALIGAMAVWGMNVTVVKLLTASFDPILLAALRMVVACAALTAIVLYKRCGMAAFSWRQLVAVAACAVLMVYANQILFVEGLLRSTATNGALIMALSPLVSAVVAALTFRERFTPQRMCGVLLGFGGVAAVVLSHPGSRLSSAGAGDLMLVAAVISFATGGAIVQRLARQLHPLAISWAIYLVGTLLLVLHTALGAAPVDAASLFPGWWPWALVLFSGVLATAVCNLIWNSAIASIGVARTAVFLYWVPVFGVVFAAILIGETLTLWHLAGFAAVMAGTYLGTWRQQPAVPAARSC
jgi:drug/metabolite transporter (DMT)-like permease